MEYDSVFRVRGASYKYAVEKYPFVFTNEFKVAASMCKVVDGDVILNIPAACVSLAKYFPNDVAFTYYEYDTNESFASLMDISHCRLDDIPHDTSTINTIVSIAGLHHASEDERIVFYYECKRVLKKDGKLVIGDVIKGSPQDDWLNGFVNKYNSVGHSGMFWNKSDALLLEVCGFDVKTEVKNYTWDFEGEKQMLDFTRHLFRLDLASDSEILEGLKSYLKPTYKEDGSISIDWSLIYFTAKVSQAPALFHPKNIVSRRQE
jgi:SAM-dependent methyltransferase